jgi:hypothetical protein
MAHRIPDMALRYRVALYYKMDKASCFNRLFSVSFSSLLFRFVLFPALPTLHPLTVSR